MTHLDAVGVYCTNIQYAASADKREGHRAKDLDARDPAFVDSTFRAAAKPNLNR